MRARETKLSRASQDFDSDVCGFIWHVWDRLRHCLLARSGHAYR